MKKFILLLIFLFTSAVSFAQDVEGVEIDSVMTYNQIVAKFGEPTRYWSHETEFGLDEEFYYDENLLYFGWGNKFLNFYISSNQFRVLTKDIEGGIKVGDLLSKMENCKYGMPKLADWLNKRENLQDGCTRYYYNPNGDADSYVIIGVRDGIIKWISFDYPV